MCGGLARWLRAAGYDTSYTPDIDDGELVRQAESESRVLISSDNQIFERRLLRDGRVRGLALPRGLTLLKQLEYVVRRLRLRRATPRCMKCNGALTTRARADVADRVPARSLLWATEFFECGGCRGVFWNGTHWRRIERVLECLGEWGQAGEEAAV